MKRISLIEYDTPKMIIDDIEEHFNLSQLNLIELLRKSGEKVQNTLGFSQNPIIVQNNHIRATGFAGILKVGKQIELEVAPKFLGLDDDNSTWREDFFYLASLSSSGNLLNSDHISSKAAGNSDLQSLIIKTFIEIYWSNHRRSLRTYKKIEFKDFSIEGEFEPESLISPSEDGFSQTNLTFDRSNQYNAIIFTAAKQLLSNSNNPALNNQLTKIIQILSPQKVIFKGQGYKKKLPSRLSRWQELYDLSIDIVMGYGLTFRIGNANSVGYIFNTWKVWEDFIIYSLVRGFGRENVIQHPKYVLGNREKMDKRYKVMNLNVIPDAIVTSEKFDFIVDAKYKGSNDSGIMRISEQDLYESLAFSKATGINKIILIYPMRSDIESELGQVNMFEKINVDNVIIMGIEIESRGISKRNSMLKFSNEIFKNILNLF